MEATVSASLQCINLTEDEFHHYSLARGVASITCTVVCYLAIVVLLPALYKAHYREGPSEIEGVECQLRRRNLRLAFYLLLITLAYLVIYVVQLEHYSRRGKNDFMCFGTGYVVQALGLMHICSTFCVSVYIFYHVYFCDTRCRVDVCVRCCSSTVQKVVCELLPFTVITVLSFVLSAAPFATQSYGETGPWCWIDDECEDDSPGFYFQLFLWYIPCGLVSLGNTLMIILVTCFIANKLQVTSAPDVRNKYKALLPGVVGFIIFQVLYLSLIAAEVSCRAVVTTVHKNTGCWFVYAVNSPTTAVLLVLAFIVYLYLGRCVVKRVENLGEKVVSYWRRRLYDTLSDDFSTCPEPPTGMGPGNRTAESLNRSVEPGNRNMESGNRNMESGNRNMDSGNRNMNSGNRIVGSGNQTMGTGNRSYGACDVESSSTTASFYDAVQYQK